MSTVATPLVGSHEDPASTDDVGRAMDAARNMTLPHELARDTQEELGCLKAELTIAPSTSVLVFPSASGETAKAVVGATTGASSPPKQKQEQEGGGEETNIGDGLLHLREEMDAAAERRRQQQQQLPSQQPRPQDLILPGRRAESESIPGPTTRSGESFASQPEDEPASRRSSRRSSVEQRKNDTSAQFVPLVARHACTAFLGLGWLSDSPSTSENQHRLEVLNDFSTEVRSLLTQAYETNRSNLAAANTARNSESFCARSHCVPVRPSPPDRSDNSRYVVLPAGTGTAITILRPAGDHPSPEHTALWLSARLVAWADINQCSLRCGLASGVLETVLDVYGLPVVSGPSIDLAARIMDCALPGQILAEEESAAVTLDMEAGQGGQNGDEARAGLTYEINEEGHEVIVDHESTAVVRTVTGMVKVTSVGKATAPGGTEQEEEGRPEEQEQDGAATSGRTSPTNVATPVVPYGTSSVPKKKWYLRLKPTELSYDPRTGAKRGKVPPTELLRRHRRVAFVGVTHDRLSTVFQKVLDSDPDHTWDRIYLLFLSDERLEWVAEEMNETVSALTASKLGAMSELESVLRGRVRELRFLEYDRPFYCGSYWDWDEPGGFIHVSPLVWGANPKVCPAMNYHWIGADPGNDYVAYQDGLASLLRSAKAIGRDGTTESAQPSNPSVLAMLAKLEKQSIHRRTHSTGMS